MTDPNLLISHEGQYILSASLLLLVGIAVLANAFRHTGAKKRILALAGVPALLMGVTYLGLAAGILTIPVTGTDREQSLLRFFAYTGIFVVVFGLIKQLIGMSRREYAILLLVFSLLPWGGLSSWLVEGTLETIASGVVLVALVGSMYVAFGPYARIAEKKGREEKLVYLKIVRLALLCWSLLVLNSILSQQALGILDNFVSQYLASVIDILFVAVFAWLVSSEVTMFDN